MTYAIAIGKMKTTDGLINVEREALRFEKLQWTSEPPTEEGWYWAIRNKTYNDTWSEEPEIAWVFDGGGFQLHFEEKIYYPNENGAVKYWLGPLPVPEPPA